MTAPLADRIEAVRRFSRFYTRRIGVLQEGLLASPFSLAEARVLYELAQRDGLAAADLARDLGLDPGYLSRILKGFETRALLTRQPSTDDARQSRLTLTPAGHAAFAPLDARSRDEVGALLQKLPESGQRRLVGALETVEHLLSEPSQQEPFVLRPHRPGDMGWVISRHGALYAEEYGWNIEFEAMVAEIAAKFIREFDPAWECCWIAERDGENVGSVFLVKQSETVGKLRMLIIEPSARGFGLGKKLVAECERFARQVGYKKITLWTNDVLLAARAIYVGAGYRLTESEKHHSFGKDLVGETWEKDLV